MSRCKIYLIFEKLSNAAYRLFKNKFRYVLEGLSAKKVSKRIRILLHRVDCCWFRLCLYDPNLIQSTLMQKLLDKIEFIMKTANIYLCTKTTKLSFLYIQQFLAASFSSRKFLIAYGRDRGNFIICTNLW